MTILKSLGERAFSDSLLVTLMRIDNYLPNENSLNNPSTPSWYVYIVKCKDSSLYTGITTDLDRRVKEHNTASSGAKYTRTRRPVELVFCERIDNRSSATKRELEIKKMAPSAKKKMIESKMKDQKKQLP